MGRSVRDADPHGRNPLNMSESESQPADDAASPEAVVRQWPASHPVAPPTASGYGDNRVPSDVRNSWLNEGYAHLKGVFNAEQIAEYNAIVARVRSEIDDGKDANNFGDRIGQLHQQETDLLKVAADPRIVDFLRWAFESEPVLMGSLQFEKGTQQEAHIDAIFFWPEPAYSMAGAWVALEDIDPDAGPLFYIPQSHRLPFFNSDDVVADDPTLSARRQAARNGELSPEDKAALVNELGMAWTQRLLELHAHAKAERITLPVKAGDVIIWHSLLAHGGSYRNNPELSRRSAVFHYFGKSAGLYSFEQFMLSDRSELPSMEPLVLPREEAFNLEYMVFPNFTAYPGGVETAHPVTRRDAEAAAAAKAADTE